jgi:hypothetical protein
MCRVVSRIRARGIALANLYTDIVTDEITRILDSVTDGFATEEIKASWIAEVKRRMAAIERGETELRDFDDVMDELRAKLRRARERHSSTG